MAININVQHNGGFLPDIILLTQGYYHRGTVFFLWRIVHPVGKFALKTMTINHFLEHWRTKITDAGEICGASREAQNIKRMRGCILLILLLLAAPGMSSNHRGRRPGARRGEDARRQSVGVRRSLFADNSSASPAEDGLGLVPLTGGRRAFPPSMHGRSFTGPLTCEALGAERRAAAERAVHGVLKVAFCLFLDQLPPRLPPRPSTNPIFTSSSRKPRSCLLRSCCTSPMRPHFLHNDENYGVDFVNTTAYVSLLSGDCA